MKAKLWPFSSAIKRADLEKFGIGTCPWCIPFQWLATSAALLCTTETPPPTIVFPLTHPAQPGPGPTSYENEEASFRWIIHPHLWGTYLTSVYFSFIQGEIAFFTSGGKGTCSKGPILCVSPIWVVYLYSRVMGRIKFVSYFVSRYRFLTINQVPLSNGRSIFFWNSLPTLSMWFCNSLIKIQLKHPELFKSSKLHNLCKLVNTELKLHSKIIIHTHACVCVCVEIV